ncbi:sodium-independent sulfate anion transporter-like [Arctopsyche grandis]|uniref:sodium-independent sulfate anion transporter-like n=1 Tax=Arctopsyche grandis TaxID=121162 RepID=UPI00406D968D
MSGDIFELEENHRKEKYIFPEKNSMKLRIRNILYRRLPILEWLPKYTKATASADLIAGISLGLTLIPQSIAYASLANLTAQYGLYSSFMGTMLYAIFGTVREVSIGPTSLMALLILQYCKGLSIDYVILLGFLSGMVIILMGILQLGFLIELISLPVTSGFTSAIASVIVISQVKGILGMRFKAENFADNIVQLYKKHQMARWQDAVLGISCIVFLLILRKVKDLPIQRKLIKKTLWYIATSRNALILLITSIIAYKLELSGPAPFLLSDRIPAGLPNFTLPKFSITQGNHTETFIQMCSKLGSGIFVIPLTAVLANIAIAKAFTINKKVDASQEMLTLGICQVMGSFVQAMPSTGAFTRSAVSQASGVKTPFSGIYSGILTLLALTFLTQHFYYIPRAALSAVLICAVIFMIDYKILGVMWKGNRWDVFTLLITYFVSLLKGMEIGLLVGVIVNISYLIYLTARPGIEIRKKRSSTGCDYILVTPESGLYYLTISFLKDVIMKAASVDGENVLPIIINCCKFQTIDYSACKGLENLAKDFEKRSQKLIFLNVSPKIIAILEPMTSINPNIYHCQSESEMLDALFVAKSDEVLKAEKVPLLSDSFCKRGSSSSEICVSRCGENGNDIDANRHTVIEEKVYIETNTKQQNGKSMDDVSSTNKND